MARQVRDSAAAAGEPTSSSFDATNPTRRTRRTKQANADEDEDANAAEFITPRRHSNPISELSWGSFGSCLDEDSDEEELEREMLADLAPAADGARVGVQGREQQGVPPPEKDRPAAESSVPAAAEGFHSGEDVPAAVSIIDRLIEESDVDIIDRLIMESEEEALRNRPPMPSALGEVEGEACCGTCAGRSPGESAEPCLECRSRNLRQGQQQGTTYMQPLRDDDDDDDDSHTNGPADGGLPAAGQATTERRPATGRRPSQQFRRTSISTLRSSGTSQSVASSLANTNWNEGTDDVAGHERGHQSQQLHAPPTGTSNIRRNRRSSLLSARRSSLVSMNSNSSCSSRRQLSVNSLGASLVNLHWDDDATDDDGQSTEVGGGGSSIAGRSMHSASGSRMGGGMMRRRSSRRLSVERHDSVILEDLDDILALQEEEDFLESGNQ